MHTIIPETAATAQPVQCATIDESQIASAASVTAQPTISHELLYTPAEAARIVYHLTDGYFDPGYILLFGKLVGDTPHRDAAAYNQLVVVREIPSCDWFHNQCILHYKMPYRHRKITYINLFDLLVKTGAETPQKQENATL